MGVAGAGARTRSNALRRRPVCDSVADAACLSGDAPLWPALGVAVSRRATCSSRTATCNACAGSTMCCSRMQSMLAWKHSHAAACKGMHNNDGSSIGTAHAML